LNCPECKSSNPDGSRFCEVCGFRLESVSPSATDAIANQPTISWETSIGLLTNPVVLKQTALTVAIAGLLMAFLLSFIMAATGEYHDILPMLRVSLIVTLVLGLLIVLLMLVFLGNRMRVRFTVNDQGMLWETIDKRVLTANRMAIFAGALGRSAQTVGAGAIAASREKEFVSWDEIAAVETNPKRLQIVLRNSWRPVMLAVCKPENYQAVTDYIAKRVRHGTMDLKAPRKILAKPVIRALLRSVAVTAASIPLFAITEPLYRDIFLPLVLYCFALAMVWLIPLFGWVVIFCAVILAIQFTLSGINEFVHLYTYEQVLFILAYVGLIFLTWFSRGALRGRFLPPLLES